MLVSLRSSVEGVWDHAPTEAEVAEWLSPGTNDVELTVWTDNRTVRLTWDPEAVTAGYVSEAVQTVLRKPEMFDGMEEGAHSTIIRKEIGPFTVFLTAEEGPPPWRWPQVRIRPERWGVEVGAGWRLRAWWVHVKLRRRD